MAETTRSREGFHFGLPMIGLPLFWDQYDNAQRLEDAGYGARLPTYDWTEDQLLGTVDRLIRDDDLAARMSAHAQGIQAREGRALGADLLVRVAIPGYPSAREGSSRPVRTTRFI
jgi:UDP:flavonoid glycosyltransferase YjiC (YdhE family)